MGKAAAFFASLSFALFLVVAFLMLRPPRAVDTQQALEDPRVRERVVAELLRSNPALFDSHPDPEVARVYSPGLVDVSFRGTRVSTNRWGMRERDYELPKPAGTLRVVLLGDSYVFGQGVAADERLGVFLETELRERGDPAGTLEVLHLGVGSWNAIAACTFVRRQLADLAPDLVVQLLVPNDLDDNSGVRGFGVRADFDPLHPERTDARVHFRYPVSFLEADGPSFLNYGLDLESRERARNAADHVVRLAGALAARGASYVLVECLPYFQTLLLQQELGERLAPGQVAHVHMDQMTTPALFVSPDDPHWNRAGHERMARYLYALIQERALLPQLALEPWPEAARELDDLNGRVVDELTRFDPPRPDVAPRFVSTRQVYGGIDRHGDVSPYASLLLGRGGGSSVELAGSCFERPELDGATVRVFAEGYELGGFELRAGRLLEESWPLPPELDAVPYVNVRFVADDWVYTGLERRDCKSFHLEGLAIR